MANSFEAQLIALKSKGKKATVVDKPTDQKGVITEDATNTNTMSRKLLEQFKKDSL